MGRNDGSAGVRMEPARRIAALWDYLPAFRAAAETGHLPSAGQALSLSPSALPRTVRMLETALGHALFDRVGRGIALNGSGELLLAAVRDAMRRIDEAVVALAGDEAAGELAVAAPRALAAVLVWPALAAATADHPRLIPRVSVLDPVGVHKLLLRGEVDLALIDRALPPTPDVVVERIASLGHGVYAGPGHPLRGRPRLELAEVARHRFVVATPAAGDQAPPDPWPPEVARGELVWVPDGAMAADACAALGALAVLPDVVGRRHPGGLERLAVRLGAHAVTELYAVTRVPVGRHRRIAIVLDAVRARAREILARQAP